MADVDSCGEDGYFIYDIFEVALEEPWKLMNLELGEGPLKLDTCTSFQTRRHFYMTALWFRHQDP